MNHMKNTILLSICFFPLLLFAQERNELSSKINEVTVYQSGARVSRIAETTVEKGTQVFFLTGISSKMDKKSVFEKSLSNNELPDLSLKKIYIIRYALSDLDH